MKWNDDILKIYLTLDELLVKGLTVEDLGMDCLEVHTIVQEIVEDACKEFDFLLSGSLDVEIFSMQQGQGLIMVVTRGEELINFFEDEEDIALFSEENWHDLYAFDDFEDVVRVCKAIGVRACEASVSLYHLNGVYYMYFRNTLLTSYNSYIPIVQEYGTSSNCPLAMLKAYGKLIMQENAIEQINTFF